MVYCENATTLLTVFATAIALKVIGVADGVKFSVIAPL